MDPDGVRPSGRPLDLARRSPPVRVAAAAYSTASAFWTGRFRLPPFWAGIDIDRSPRDDGSRWSSSYLEQTSRLFRLAFEIGSLHMMEPSRSWCRIAAWDSSPPRIARSTSSIGTASRTSATLNSSENVTFEIEPSPKGPRAKMVRRAQITLPVGSHGSSVRAFISFSRSMSPLASLY